MVDQISIRLSCNNYFSECAATYCTYSTYERQYIITIVTRLISVASGLSVALKLITRIIMHAVYGCLQHVLGM